MKRKLCRHIACVFVWMHSRWQHTCQLQREVDWSGVVRREMRDRISNEKRRARNWMQSVKGGGEIKRESGRGWIREIFGWYLWRGFEASTSRSGECRTTATKQRRKLNRPREMKLRGGDSKEQQTICDKKVRQTDETETGWGTKRENEG